MEAFLSNGSRAVKAGLDQTGKQVHVVQGNEACDVDSMVSALVFAYFLHKTIGGETLYIPLLNIRQSDLALRSDSLFLLRQTGLSPDLLVFRDQLDLHAIQKAGRLRMTLVDHNILPDTDKDLEEAVVEVMDHHQLEREPSPSCRITVETVGSCCTLVSERFLQMAPDVLDQQLAQLLHATVLLDCINMAPAAGKVTPKDSQVVAALETRFPALPQRGALFQALQNAKFDVSGLDTQQMLMKDLKLVSAGLSVGVSALYLPMEDFLRRSDVEDRLAAFCRQLGLDLLVLMSISFSDTQEPIRELAVFSHSATCRDQLSQHLEQSQYPDLDLSPLSSPHPHITAYHQGNSVASRKKVLPLVKNFLDNEEEDGGGGGGRRGGCDEYTRVPPTPMNSLVDGCPLDGGLPGISAQDLQEKFSKMANAPDL